MIEESLLKSNFVGKDGFIWWIGQVADPSVWRNEKTRIDTGDSAWSYRCKVRIVGYHSFSPNELPDKDLPWAHVLTSASDGAPAQGGFGKLPLLIGGETVVGFFLDGDEAQQPVVMGCFHRSPAVINVDNPNPFDAFPGYKGPFSNSGGHQATRQKQQPLGQLKDVPTSFGSGPQVTMFSNPSFGTAEPESLDLSPGFVPLGNNTTSNAGANYKFSASPKNETLFYAEKAEANFLGKIDREGDIPGENGCSNNIISQITATLQNFIKFINSLESTAYGFIDPLRNKVVDMQKMIRKVARMIASTMKSVINGIRDNIFNLVACLFKIFGITLPSPFKLPISEATKNILNLIFCLFEKLFGSLWDFVAGLLNGLIGRSPNIPRCAAEETIAVMVSKLADMIDDSLATIVSGLDWLANGIGQVAGAIRQGLNFISQILSFLSCDSLACQNVTSWDPFSGVTLPQPDKWKTVLDNIDIFGGIDDQIDTALGYMSIFGSLDTPFSDCRQRIVDPKTQVDAPKTPIGVKYGQCIPPEVIINGNGIGAKAQAVVSSLDGSILTIQILDRGKGYTDPPRITILDNTRYGIGAIAKSTINPNGELESIYLIKPGKGYCQTNLNIIVTGIPTTTPIGGVSPTIIPGTAGIATIVPGANVSVTPIFENLGLSTVAVGVVTSVVIDSPGVGYTSGDIVYIGDCIYRPIVSNNGSIIKLESSDCIQEFLEYPTPVINSSQGEGAILYPVISYVPQYILDNTNVRSRVGIGTTIVNVVQCV